MANEVVERFYDALDVSSIGNDMEASLKMLRELDDETLKGLLDQQLSTSSALLLRLADMRVKESAKASHFEDVFGVRLSDNISSWIEKQMRVVEVDIGDSDPYLERVDFRLPPVSLGKFSFGTFHEILEEGKLMVCTVGPLTFYPFLIAFRSAISLRKTHIGERKHKIMFATYLEAT